MDTVKRLAPSVILVRHARPIIDPLEDAENWALDQSAIGDATALGTRLLSFEPDGVIASPEPKALETGHIIGRELKISCEVDDGIREQGGGAVPWIETPEAFRDGVADHFARPKDVVLGDESSRTAADRFAVAVERARTGRQCPVIVTHGRVMCGYLAKLLNVDPMTIWPTLLLPDALMLDFDTMRWHRIEQEEVA